MDDSWKYAEDTLDKVSRTFALNIRVLGNRLRKPITLAYLYMRMADTIEDDPELSIEQKKYLLKKFSRAVKLGTVDDFLDALPASWNNNGKPDCALCVNAATVIPLLSTYPEPVVNSIKKAVEEMSTGMAIFAEKDFVIETEKDLDKYCYYVAGIVGEMLTELFGSKEKELGISFGLALQLVNIIKDMQEDSERGVSFVPKNFTRADMIAKAKRHLQDAKNYIKLLPRHKYRRRLFCLWPSLMAVENLRALEEGKLKITRKDVKRIVTNSTLFGWSNSWIEKQFG